MLSPKVEVTITPNRIVMRNIGDGRSAGTEAPFSCSHLLADDVDIFEHAALGVLKQVVGGGLLPAYPQLSVFTAGRPLHDVERKVIAEALLNAGASKVQFGDDVGAFGEQAEARASYVATHGGRR